MPTSDIGIDLGTRNSQVYSTGRGLVVSEPSVVVYDKNSEKISHFKKLNTLRMRKEPLKWRWRID